MIKSVICSRVLGPLKKVLTTPLHELAEASYATAAQLQYVVQSFVSINSLLERGAIRLPRRCIGHRTNVLEATIIYSVVCTVGVSDLTGYMTYDIKSIITSSRGLPVIPAGDVCT